MVTFISSRLGIRLLGLLLIGVILSFGILTYLIVRREGAILMEFNREKSSLLADSITKNLREAMLEKDPAIVKRMLSSHNSIAGIKAAVFRSDGSLAYGEIDYNIPHDIVTTPKERTLQSNGNLVFLKPLLNEKECHKCHNPRDRIRGIVVVNVSTERVAKEIRETEKRVALFAVVMAFLSGVCLIFVIRKMIVEPLTVLKDGTGKIRDGDLSHRIDMKRKDELGALAHAFNQMTEEIENARKGLENAVIKKTKELRVIAELSTKVFRGDLTLKEILERFLAPITEDLGYSFCVLCLVDKETGLLHLEYKHGVSDAFCAPEITLADNHPFAKAILEAKPSIGKAEKMYISDITGYIAMVPIVSHQKKRCREVNLCTYTHCPAFNNSDERCWLIKGTFCRSPHAVRGKNKIFGCLHCEAFPLTGILIAGSDKDIGKSSLHFLEILASEIESAIENYRLIHEKRNDIQNLIRLHNISVESITSLSLHELSSSIVSASASFANADASLLWLAKDAKTLRLQDSSTGDTYLVPPVLLIEDSFVGRSIIENRPIETINTGEITCLKDLIEAHGFLYAASIPLKGKHATIGCLTLLKKNDFFMTDSEKAIISLYASQAASAITTARIYEDLKHQKEFSDAIFNCAVSGVMVLDKEGTIMKINQAGLEILQFITENIIGKNITEIYPEAREMLAITTNIGREMMITLKDGVTRPIGFTSSPLFDKDGEEKGIITVFRDLTEIKELQAEVRKKQHFEAIGKVISGVAHEVRNPLFAVQSIAQILERETESAQHQALISALLKETYRMRNLVEELLLYSKPSMLNIIDLDLGILLAELNEYIKVKKYDATLSINVPSLTFKADKDKLMQVFLNLLDNAFGAGGKRIEITSEKKDNRLRIAIRDDGVGIKSNDLERIFDPFFTTKREGTGLGLPICKKIIEDHGGNIEIRSSEGKGTTVILTLKES